MSPWDLIALKKCSGLKPLDPIARLPRAEEGAEKREKQISGAKALVDYVAFIAGTEVPAYQKTVFFSAL